MTYADEIFSHGKEKSPIDDLVDRFSAALRAKLHSAEAKYGYNDAWKRDDWQDTLIRCMHEHIAKGDPCDVAAYCAFAWHHGFALNDAHLRREVKVPEGWQLVPIHADENMHRAQQKYWASGCDAVWSAMLAAAPTTTATDGQGGEG